MAVLAGVRLSAQLDLGILSLLVQPIKTDLGLSDSQIGLLLGLAFALFHTVVGVPLAGLVDRYSRRAILAVGVAFWSLMTAFTGLANSFMQLFWFRVGVGAGEAVNGPATYSMIADLFPRERLARAISMINLGTIAGGGLSLILGAIVIKALAHMTMPTLPVVGQLKHWQMVFFIVGLPGLLLAAAMMMIPEPKRRSQAGRTGADKNADLREVLAYLRANWQFFLPMFAAVALMGIESGGTGMWRPAFFQRTYGWSAQQVGMTTGIIQLIAGPLGLLIGSWLAERLARRRDDANLRVVTIAWLFAIPFAVAGPLMPTGELSLACGGFGTMFSMMGAPTQNAAMQSVAPGHMRGRITALYLLIFSLASQGIGPSFIAGITDFVLHDDTALRYALAFSAAVMMPVALAVMALGVRPYGREITRIKQMEADALHG